MLQINATYRLTTAGQRNEIVRTGQPVGLEQTLSGEIDPALLNESRILRSRRTTINSEGKVSLNLNADEAWIMVENGVEVNVAFLRTTLAADIATLISDLDAAIAAAMERKLAERQQKLDEVRRKTLEVLNNRTEKPSRYLIMGLGDASGNSSYINVPVCDWPSSADDAIKGSPEAQAWEADVERRAAVLIAEGKARVAEYQLAHELAQAREAREKDDFIRAYVTEHMPADLARFDDGLLCQDELHNHMRDHVFAPLGDFPRYEKITKQEVLSALDIDSDDKVVWQTETPECVSSDIYARKQQIEKVLPGCSVELKEHSGSTDRNDTWWVCHRIGLLVSMFFGPFKLSREFSGE
jgi:hypothetical protein